MFGSSQESRKRIEFPEVVRSSVLYTWGLIDDAFLKKNPRKKTRDFLFSLIERISNNDGANPPNNFLVEKKIITAVDFQSEIKTPLNIDEPVLAALLNPDDALLKILDLIVSKNILKSSTLWKKFLVRDSFFNRAIRWEGFDWEHLVKSGILQVDQIGERTDGFDAVEIKALQEDLLGATNKVDRYPLDKTAHPLVQRLRGQENTKKLSQQINLVLGPTGQGSVMEDFQKVFNYYLPKTNMFAEISRREKTTKKRMDEIRRRHIKIVNENQIRKLKMKNENFKVPPFYDPQKRHFDIYARYGHGLMDPLQLAFIAKAAEWYIMGERSLLFNSVRIVPYRNNEEKNVPKIAQAMCQGSNILNVVFEDFKDSMVGSNRTFFTHSNSVEATELNSIPIIGLATKESRTKRSNNPDDYVVFNALFDPQDGFTWDAKQKGVYGVNGDITGLINESLRTMVEVEHREIARAEAELAKIEMEVETDQRETGGAARNEKEAA